MNTATQAAFDRGASRYDVMVALNPGYHRELRRASAALAERIGDEPARLLDLACGSGASTRALVEAAHPGSRIVGVDGSVGMLEQAMAKRWPAGVTFEQGLAGQLDVARLQGFDGILTCYLFRNVAEASRDDAVAEAFAMLRPGGWLVVQEYSVRGNPVARAVWDAVCLGVIIPLGTVVDQNPSLYRYLRHSVHDFDAVGRFADRLVGAGFTDVAHRSAGGWQRGILHTFVARRPEEHR